MATAPFRALGALFGGDTEVAGRAERTGIPTRLELGAVGSERSAMRRDALT